jgi:hypothetical protein
MFRQSSDLTFPVVTAIASDSTTITLTGTDYMVDDYLPMVQVAGVNAESVELTDDSNVVALWSKGVPPAVEAEVSLWFEEIEGNQVFFADTTLITLENPLEIASVADVSCSFAGGCTYQVEGIGVATMM